MNPEPNAMTQPGKGGLLRFLPAVARILLGLPLLFSGLNGFFPFAPPPDVTLPDRAAAFVGALAASGYMMPLIFATHLIVGLLLLLNRFVPLALVLFAPFMVHSVAFHLVLEPSGLVMSLVFLAVLLYLGWVHRAAYRPLFAARFRPYPLR